MIQKRMYCIFCLLALIGCKPESPLSPGSGQLDSVHTHKDYLYTDKEMFTLYVDNTYNVDQDITIYMQPLWILPGIIWDYFLNGGSNSVGIAYGGECTEIGIFDCDSLTCLTGIYGWEISESTFAGRATEDTVNTWGMSEYTWVFDEQTRWLNFIFESPTGIEETE